MTIVRRRVALIAGTVLLAGVASSGVAMAGTPAVAHSSVQSYCGHDNWSWGGGCNFRGFGDHGRGDFRGHGDHGDHGRGGHGDHGRGDHGRGGHGDHGRGGHGDHGRGGHGGGRY